MKKLYLIGLLAFLSSCGIHHKSNLDADIMGYGVSADTQSNIVVKAK